MFYEVFKHFREILSCCLLILFHLQRSHSSREVAVPKVVYFWHYSKVASSYTVVNMCETFARYRYFYPIFSFAGIASVCVKCKVSD